MKKVIVIMVMLAGIVSVSAQKSKTVTVSGEWNGTDITVVKEKALHAAKLNALIEAGVKEDIISTTSLIISNGGSEAIQVVNELSMIELDGRITLKGSPKYDMEVVNNDIIKVVATITAKVDVREEKNDPTFGLEVEGMSDVYRDGERMEFKVTPYGSDCFVRVFWFDGMPADRHEGAVMYPDKDGRYVDALFKTGTEYLFPKLPASHSTGRPTKITMRKQVAGQAETCVVWVVALKKQVPYDVPCTYEDFLKWLHRIPANERVVRFQPVTIIGK